MARDKKRARRRFLKSMSTGVPAALFGVSATTASGRGIALPSLGAGEGPEGSRYIDLGRAAAGDHAIPFRKHTLDLGPAETVTVADMNGDGRLDIVCGESWYEQAPPERGQGLRFTKHKFRSLSYTDF